MIDEHGTYSDLYFDTGYELAGKVKFTQNDIREIQMAKAAIRAGVDILVKRRVLRLTKWTTVILQVDLELR